MYNGRLTKIFWLFIEKFGLIGLSCISFFTFAWLLTPEQLGLGAIALVFCELLSSSLCSIFENPLVRRKCLSETELSTAFWFGGSIALCLTMGTAALIYITDFNSTIAAMLALGSIAVVADVQARPFLAKLRTNHEFKSIASRTIWGKVAGTIVATAAAFMGAGEWALIIQLTTMNFISLVILLKLPASFLWVSPSLESLRSVLWEGAPIGYRKLVNSSFERGVFIILSVTSPAAVVGYFAFAKRLVELPKQALISSVMSYSVPVFTNRDQRSDKSRDIFQVLTIWMVYMLVPSFCFLGIFGSQILSEVFGEKWLEAQPYFLFFAVLAAVQCLDILILPIQAAYGKSSFGIKSDTLKVTVLLVIYYFLIKHFGVWTAISVLYAEAIITVAIRYVIVSKIIKPLESSFYWKIFSIYLLSLMIGLLSLILIYSVSLSVWELTATGVLASISYLVVSYFLGFTMTNLKGVFARSY